MPDGASAIELELLPECTVRIDVGGVPKGTGFFVAPGVVVTCAHVIESAQFSPGETDPVIEVVRTGSDTRLRATTRSGGVWPKTQADVALLQLDTVEHPSVLLGPGLEVQDTMYTFGFPQTHPEGTPTSLSAVGFTGDGKLLKFTDGQVMHGMSGSPVYNRRTGAVCAMVKRSIDPRTDYGGYGVRVETLYQLDPQVFQTANQRYHTTSRAWLDRVTSEQRARLRPARQSMATEGVRFILTIGNVGDEWEVRANVDDNGALGPVFVDLNNIRAMVARLLREWASRDRVDVGSQNQLLGEIMYRAAFPGEIGEQFDALLDAKKDRPIFLGVHFRDDAEERLVTLPWEHLFVPRGGLGMYLASEPCVSLVRCRSTQSAPGQPTDRRDLSVLMVAVQPPRVSSGDEDGVFDPRLIEDVTRRANELNKIENLTVEIVEASDPEQLADTIADRDDQVVHVVAFGCYRRRAGESQRTEELVADFTFDALTQCLQRGNQNLVVLQLLEAARQRIAADFAYLAPTLVSQSISAVVGYQYPVSPEDAAKFNSALYKALAGGASIHGAVQSARNSVWFGQQASRAFISPALFVAGPGSKSLVAVGGAGGQRAGGPFASPGSQR